MANYNEETADEKNEFYKNMGEYYLQKPNKKPHSKEKIACIINEINLAKEKRHSKERREYHLLENYDVMTLGDKSHLIRKNADITKIVHVVPYEDLYDSLYDCHVNKTAHGGRCKMEQTFADKFQIPRPCIETFIACCKVCNEKRSSRRKLVIKPIMANKFSEQGQVDLIDFQSLSDCNYKWILIYQDHSTKFVILRPLTSKCAYEVATQLLNIFLLIGAPKVLQSDSGIFVNSVIQVLHDMWPESVIINGRSRHPQSHRLNKDIENMVRAWMTNTSCKQWSIGLNFVQWQKNSSPHRIGGRSPYSTLFGSDPKLGLASTNISLPLLNNEEMLEMLQDDEDNKEQKRNLSSSSKESAENDTIVIGSVKSDDASKVALSSENEYDWCTAVDPSMLQ